MSSEYILYVDTFASPGKALELLLVGLNMDAKVEAQYLPTFSDYDYYIDMEWPGFVVSSYKTGDRIEIEKAFGIRPTIVIMFQLNSDHDRLKQSKPRLVEAIVAALKQIPGDATLIFNGTYAHLLRKNEEITFDYAFPFLWNEETLPLLSLPHKQGDLSAFKG